MSDDMDITNDDMGNMEITEDDKLWALLAYVFAPLVPVIILLMEDKKDRPFIKAHNAQALVWGLLNVVVSVFSPALLCAPTFIIWVVGIYWGYQAYQGKMVNIPVVTDFVKNQGWA